jgi:hypothetical protein
MRMYRTIASCVGFFRYPGPVNSAAGR